MKRLSAELDKAGYIHTQTGSNVLPLDGNSCHRPSARHSRVIQRSVRVVLRDHSSQHGVAACVSLHGPREIRVRGASSRSSLLCLLFEPLSLATNNSCSASVKQSYLSTPAMSQLQRQASTPSVAASSASSSSSQTAANGNPKKLQIVPAPFPERRDFLAPYTQRVGILTKHQPGMFKKDPWKARFIVVTQMASPKEPNKIFDSIHSFKTNEPLKWEQERLRLTTESTVTVTDELAGDANIYVLKLTGMVPLNRGNASPGFLMPPEQQGKFYFAMDNAQECASMRFKLDLGLTNF